MKRKRYLLSHRTRNSDQLTRALTRAVVWGSLAGTRSMLAPALASRRLNSPMQKRLKTPRMRGCLMGLAALEFIADKTPWVPSRIAPPALAGRALSGALVGSASTPPRRWWTFQRSSRASGPLPLALLGASAAVAAAYATYHARRLAKERLGLPNVVSGLLEDGLALLIASKLP